MAKDPQEGVVKSLLASVGYAWNWPELLRRRLDDLDARLFDVRLGSRSR